MGAVVVLDASVVIGVLEVEDEHHEAAAEAVDAHLAEDLRLPASAYAEVLARPARRGALEIARERVLSLPLTVDPIGREAAEAAAALRGRHPSLRLPDALVLGHAHAIGADLVLTTDRRWSRLGPSVHVVG